MKVFIILFLGLIVFIPGKSQSPIFDKAYEYYLRKDYIIADSLCTLSIRNESDNKCNSLRLRSLTRTFLGDTAKATIDINDALKYCPTDANVHYSSGTVHLLKKQYKEAILDYTNAIKLNPKRLDFYLNRSTAYGLYGDSAGYVRDLLLALEIDSSFSKAYNNLAIYYKNTNEYKSAILYFEKAIKYEPKNINYLIGLSYCKLKSGYFLNAISDCNEILNLAIAKDEIGDTYLIRGQAYIGLNNLRKACEDFNFAYYYNKEKSIALIERYCK